MVTKKEKDIMQRMNKLEERVGILEETNKVLNHNVLLLKNVITQINIDRKGKQKKLVCD